MKQQTKTIKGVVTSNKMMKTIVVESVSKVRHEKYKKFVNKTSVYHVHDEAEQASEGDVVLIKSTRPISKTKSWELVSVVGK